MGSFPKCWIICEVHRWENRWSWLSPEPLKQWQVLDVREPLLQLLPASMKEMNISNFEAVEMVVDFFPTSRCSNYSTADVSQLMVQWEYLLRNDTICVEEIPRPMDAVNASDNMSNMSNDSNDTNESNVRESNDSSFLNWSNQSNLSYSDTIMISRPCVELIWQPLENTSFRDLNPRPGSLRLPAFSFQPNSSHQFRAAATFQVCANRILESPTSLFASNMRCCAFQHMRDVSSLKFTAVVDAWHPEGYTGRNPSVMFTVNIQERTRQEQLSFPFFINCTALNSWAGFAARHSRHFIIALSVPFTFIYNYFTTIVSK